MLEIRKNTFARSYENSFFRYFSKALAEKFEEKNFEGLLLGSPFCEVEERLQIDALLITTHSICIIDFKNYSEKITLPEHNNFEQGLWFDAKGNRVGGGSSINPFLQLKYQKSRFEKVFEHAIEPYILSTDKINIYHTEKIVCFQNQVEFEGEVPAKYTNFHVTDKEHFVETILDIIDIKNETSLSKESFEAFNEVFLAAPYKYEELTSENIDSFPDRVSFHLDVDKLYQDQKVALTEIEAFLRDEKKNAFILQGSLNSGKTELVPYIKELAHTTGISEVEVLASSQRVAKNLMESVKIENINSIYSYIYGGKTQYSASPNSEEESEPLDLFSGLEVIPLKASDNSEETLFIVDESQLISDAYYQSFDIRFGSGHLLKDLLSFIEPAKSKRKIIFIGDPYLIQMGSNEESALNPKYLEEDYKLNVTTFQLLDKSEYSHITHEALKCVHAIRNRKFNELSFVFSDKFLKVDRSEILAATDAMINIHSSGHILTYSNEDANRINLWIKNKILNTGNDIAPTDLVSFYNNITLAHENDPFAKPQKIYNGEFAIVELIGETVTESISLRGKGTVSLHFRELTLRLRKSGDIVTVLALENFRLNPKSELSDEEIVAMNVLLNQELKKVKEKLPFTSSEEYEKLMQHPVVKDNYTANNDFIVKVIEGKRVKDRKNLSDIEKELKGLITQAKQAYVDSLKKTLYQDSTSKYFRYKNAAYLRYGWAMTVHRSMSYKFKHVIFNVNQGEDRGRNNDAFFRWIYTGLSRATETIQLTNYQPITPFDKIVVKEKVLGVKPKEVLFYSSSEDNTERLKNFERFITNKLQAKNVKIKSIEHLNWQEQYTFSGENGEEAIFGVYYDKKGYFKKFILMKSEPSEFGELISKLVQQKVPLEDFEFVEDRWKKTSYQILAKEVGMFGLNIENIVPNNYHDTIKLFMDDSDLEIDIWYGDEGMFSKVIPRYYTDNDIWEKFKQALDVIRGQYADK